jgi:hypothetical protein
MKSDLMEKAREELLPEMGAEFELTYFDGEEEVPKDQVLTREHTHVTAVSSGIRATVIGNGTYVCQRRQKKPLIQEGTTATMLVIEMDGVWVHLLGDHLVVARERLNIGQLTACMKGER